MLYTMSKIKLLTVAVIGLLLLNLCTVGFLLMRKPPKHPEGRMPGEQEGPKNIIIEKLHFDKEQVAQYEQLIDQHQSSVRKLTDSIKNAKNDLYRSLQEVNSTDKDALIARLGSLQRQIELTHYDHFAAIRSLCKPDQLEYYNQLTKELARFFAPPKKDGPPPKD